MASSTIANGPVPNETGSATHVLILVPGSAAALAVECALASRPKIAVTVTVCQEPPAQGTSSVGHDLIAIDLAGASGRFLAFGVEALAINPDADVLFFCEDESSPGAVAAATLGLRSTVLGAGARAWLVGALPALVAAARARRALRSAEAVIPPHPRGCAAAGPAAAPRTVLSAVVPLPVAENRFREAYVCGLLASAGDRTRAAKQAGIPYRTLCRILQFVVAGSPALPNEQ